MANLPCPRVLGIDEHFFTRKKGFATTFVDLRKHRVFDVKLGRSEPSLRRYLRALKGKDMFGWWLWICLKPIVVSLDVTFQRQPLWQTDSTL